MTRVMKDFGVPLVVVLEGGYNFDTLQWGSETVVKSLLGEEIDVKKMREDYVPNRVGIYAVEETINQLEQYWPSVNTK